MKSRNKSTQQGFTLIELVVVIVIIGILAAFAIPRFSNIAVDARTSSVNALLGSIRSTSALVHGLSLARPTENPISLEGSDVDIVNAYPAGTGTGIDAALSSTSGYSVIDKLSGTTPGRLFQVVGATTLADCSVWYVEPAAANTAPSITATTSGC